MYLYPDNVHFASTVDLVGGPSLTFKLHRINIFPTYDYVRSAKNHKWKTFFWQWKRDTVVKNRSARFAEFLREERREDTFKKKHRSLTGWWNLENESSLSKR